MRNSSLVLLVLLLLPLSARAELLDERPGALAAYSLRRIAQRHTGPAVQVQRSTDHVVRDFGFTPAGELATAELETWLDGGDGRIARWYSQLPSHPPRGHVGPLIAEKGKLVTDAGGRPRLKFDDRAGLRVAGEGLPEPFNIAHMTVVCVLESAPREEQSGSPYVLCFQSPDAWGSHAFALIAQPGAYWFSHAGRGFDDAARVPLTWRQTIATAAVGPDRAAYYQNYEVIREYTAQPESGKRRHIWIGTHSKKGEGRWRGWVSELLVYPFLETKEEVRTVTDQLNAYYQLGPTEYAADAILPQQFAYQVEHYQWLASLSVKDVALPKAEIRWDGNQEGSQENVDRLADLWLELEGATASSVVRGEPQWYASKRALNWRARWRWQIPSKHSKLGFA